MNTYEPVDATTHQSIKIHPNAGVEFGKTQHLISIRVTEIDKAISSFPVFFYRNPQTGKLAIAAMASFIPGENLFVHNDKWDASYTPVTLETHPFHVITPANAEMRYTLSINVDSPFVNDDNGHRLFDDNGRATIYLSTIKSLVDAEFNNELITREFLETIDALGLIIPIDLEMEFADGRTETISGLQTVAEDKLRLLEQEAFFSLHKKGYLIPLHGALMSLFQINGLIKRHNAKYSEAAIKNIHLRLQRTPGL